MTENRADCTPPEERIGFEKDWTCDEIHKFETAINVFVYTGYITKGIQMAIFLFLILLLIYQRWTGKKQIGALSVFIVALSFFNSVFSLIRIQNLNPLDRKGTIFKVVYCLENFCFFGATWLFSTLYYETATDIEQILSID